MPRQTRAHRAWNGQDFADVETYGVQRWLGELALALRQETYRPDPIRRVFIPKANSTAKSPKLEAVGCVFRAIVTGDFAESVTDVSRKRDRDFALNVTDEGMLHE